MVLGVELGRHGSQHVALGEDAHERLAVEHQGAPTFFVLMIVAASATVVAGLTCTISVLITSRIVVMTGPSCGSEQPRPRDSRGKRS